jgi:aminoglycoside phosphotransferase (APT) family kinase protein
LIPAEKSEAVSRALREAFGASEFEDISRVIGGHTNSLVFRIVLRGTPYLLKIIVRNEDPGRHYTSMRAAAEAGVAPRVWYTNSEDRIAITDFVNAKPLPVDEALTRWPAMLRTLHALPPFGRAPFNTSSTFLLGPGPAVGGYLEQFRGYLEKFLASDILSPSGREEFAARHAEIIAVYPREDEMVSSHNDMFKPDNILFDGKQVWLVDWEAAFLNDRYADLAVLAHHVATDDERETVYLAEYFGKAPDDYQRARFHLMQQLSHLFYAMAYLSQGVQGTTIDWSSDVPGFDDFYRRMWARDVDLTNKDVKVTYGRIHWERLLRNVRQPRYREALKVVGSGKATACQ